MANLSVTVTLLFFLFAFSYAHIALDETDIGIPVHYSVSTAPDSESKKTIFLPSERTESDPTDVVDWTSESMESKLPESANKESAESDVDSVPLTIISFRPINSHFQIRQFPPSLRRGRRCRHLRNHQFRPWDRAQGREVSYGDDMILSDKNTKFDGKLHGGVRQIPTVYIKSRAFGPKSPIGTNMDMTEEFKGPHHHYHHYHHHHRHHHNGQEGEEEREKHEHKHGGGIMMKIRKFLNQF